MKRITFLLLVCVGFSHADINVTPGVGATVHADVVNGQQNQVIEIVGPSGVSSASVTSIGLKVDLSTTSIPSAIQLASGTTSTPFSVIQSSYGVNASTGVVVPMTGSQWPVTGTFFQALQPVTQQNTVAVVPASGTFSANLINSTVGVAGTVPVSVATPYQVFQSSWGANASTSVITQMVGTTFNDNLINSTVGVVSAGAFNLTNTTVGITGSLSATTNFPSTATVGGSLPNAVMITGGTNGTSAQDMLLTASSAVVVAINPSSNTVSANEATWTQAVPVTSTQVLSAATTLYILNGSSTSIPVGYQIGGSSIPVNVLNSLSATAVSLSTAAVGSATATVPVTALNGLVVSSAVVPTPQADGHVQMFAGSNIGQMLVTGIAPGVIQSTSNVYISSSSTGKNATSGAEIILVSSPAVGNNAFTYLCDCVFSSTMTLTGNIVIESPNNTITKQIYFQEPSSPAPFGAFRGCMQPFFRSAPSANIYIYQTMETQNAPINYYCDYFTAP